MNTLRVVRSAGISVLHLRIPRTWRTLCGIDAHVSPGEARFPICASCRRAAHEIKGFYGVVWCEDDGGRKAAGRKGYVNDCVVRGISILTARDYTDTYNELMEMQRLYLRGAGEPLRASPAKYGIDHDVIMAYMKARGWKYRVRASSVVPRKLGRFLVDMTDHVVAVIDGIAFDKREPTRGGKRKVAGFYYRDDE